MSVTVAPHGLWKSPITGNSFTARSVSLSQVRVDGPDTGVWTVDADLGERNGAGSERVARDRGLPQAVRCDGDGHSASLSGMANQYLYLNARAKALRTSQADAPLI